MKKWVSGEIVGKKHWADGLYSLQIDAEIQPYRAGQFIQVALDLEGERVAALEFIDARVRLKPAATPFAHQVESAISRWLRDAGSQLALPLTPPGSDFQSRVRAALLAIPPGEVRSYGELARQLGSSARAVGGACRRNADQRAAPSGIIFAPSCRLSTYSQITRLS